MEGKLADEGGNGVCVPGFQEAVTEIKLFATSVEWRKLVIKREVDFPT